MHVARPQGRHHELVVVGAGDDQRRVPVPVVVAVPEGQLLVAVGQVIHGVQVEREVARRGPEGGDELVEEHVASALDGVGAQGVVVVLVLVAGLEAMDPGADHLQEAGPGEVGVAGVVGRLGEGPREPEALVELEDGEQSGVAGQLAPGRLGDEWRAEEIEDS
jgi:hypothetical protein